MRERRFPLPSVGGRLGQASRSSSFCPRAEAARALDSSNCTPTYPAPISHSTLRLWRGRGLQHVGSGLMRPRYNPGEVIAWLKRTGTEKGAEPNA
jgi:hypothetical protein